MSLSPRALASASVVACLVALCGVAHAQDAGGLDASLAPSPDAGAHAGANPDAGAPAPRAAADASAGPGHDADAGAPAVPPDRIVPPVALVTAQPRYPADGDGRRVDVEILLTIDPRGEVTLVEVLGHIPADAAESFDVAAREAARTLRFRPATRGGAPITVRARYHMVIAPPLVPIAANADAGAEPPVPEVEEIGGGTEGLVHTHGAPAPAPDAGAERPRPEGGITVRGAGRERAGATTYDITLGQLGNVPRTNGADMVTLAPGVMVSNEGTEGHAQHVFLRGFTGENGQDIAFSLDGIPLNEESNVHGQGYADLYFVIPELVARLDVTEGNADPRQGNFAIAGSIDYRLALRQRGVTLRGSFGTYGYRRLVALYGPQGASDDSFAGVDYSHADGFGPSRNYDRASALAQHAIDLGGGATLRVLAGLYASRWVSPGVVREDDVLAGRAGFFDAYASAGRQGGFSTRAIASAALEWRRERERAELRAWAQLRDLGLTENFTGYVLRRSEGDLIEQRYGGATVGAAGFYQREVRALERAHQLEAGFFLRHDRYALAQRRLDVVTSAPAASTDPNDVDANVHATNIGLYLDAALRPIERVTVRAGARLDAIAYAIDAATLRATDPRAVRVFRTALGVHAGPKLAAELDLGRGFTALASLGSGFRSPDALALADGENTPFASVLSEEVGARYARAVGASGARVTASLAGYHASVAQDLLFDPTAGRAVPIGATRRLGAVLWVRAQPVPWIDVNASVTYTRATVETDALGRTVPAGALLPYVPPWVARLDAAGDRPVGTLLGLPARVRAGLGAQFYGARPLPLDDRSEPVFLVDASAGFRLGPADLGLSARNLFDARWRDAQLNFASNYLPGALPSLFPVRHFTAGAPFTLFATLTLNL